MSLVHLLSPDCDILIQGDQSISRKHATICVEGEPKVQHIPLNIHCWLLVLCCKLFGCGLALYQEHGVMNCHVTRSGTVEPLYYRYHGTKLSWLVRCPYFRKVYVKLGLSQVSWLTKLSSFQRYPLKEVPLYHLSLNSTSENSINHTLFCCCLQLVARLHRQTLSSSLVCHATHIVLDIWLACVSPAWQSLLDWLQVQVWYLSQQAEALSRWESGATQQ